MTAVIAASGRDMPRPIRKASKAAASENSDGADNQCPLRVGRCCFVFGDVLDQFEDGDRLAGIVLDLPEVEHDGMAVERGIAAHRGAVEYALQFSVARERFFREARSDIGKSLAVDAMHGEVDAETPLDAVDELLVEGDADIRNARRSCRRA